GVLGPLPVLVRRSVFVFDLAGAVGAPHLAVLGPVGLPAGPGIVSLVTIAVLLPTSRPEEERAAYGTGPDTRRFGIVLAAGTPAATGAFAGFTYLVKFLGDVSGFSPSTVTALFVAFGIACLAGVSITGALLDRRAPR
ncbi:MFS transporter, partial [Streptomyces sp. NPDC058231]